jgi:hypothetical protein
MQFDLVIIKQVVEEVVGQSHNPRSWKAMNETISSAMVVGNMVPLGAK